MPQVQAQQKLTTCRIEISYFPPWKYLDRTVLIRLFGYLVTVFESVGECQATTRTKGNVPLSTVFVSTLRHSIDSKNQFLYSRSQDSACFTRRSHGDFFAKRHCQVGMASGARWDSLRAGFRGSVSGFRLGYCRRSFCSVHPAFDVRKP